EACGGGGNAGGPAGKELGEQANELLGTIHAAEWGAAAIDVERRPAPPLDSVREEYRKLFESCEIRQQYKAKTDQNVDFLKRFRPRYEEVGKRLGIPWHFIGAIHCLEASFGFGTHLHNGDPLAHRT